MSTSEQTPQPGDRVTALGYLTQEPYTGTFVGRAEAFRLADAVKLDRGQHVCVIRESVRLTEEKGKP